MPHRHTPSGLVVAAALLLSALPTEGQTATPLFPRWIDFNDANNYTQPGYTGLGPATYSPAAGMGWDVAPSAKSRWSYDYLNLYRDAHHSNADRTFRLDVPDGRYTVRLYFLNTLLAANDNDRLQVFAEGRLALDLPTMPRDPNMTRILRAEVADGQLDLRFHDDGGAGNTWCVSGLSVSEETDWPEIASLSAPSASPGESIVIKGTAFGTRTAATPVIWEDFESGTVGTSLATGGWSVGTSANLPPIYSSELAYSGGIAGMSDFPAGSVAQSTCCAYKSGLSLDEVYVSYHVFIRRNSGVQTRNLKLLRVHSGAIDFLHGDPNIGMTNQNSGGQIYASGETNWSGYVGEGTWHRVELYAKLSSVDQCDGAWEGWIDQRPIAYQDRSMLAKSSYSTNRFRFVALPIYCAHDEGGDYDVFYDDVYVDSSRARVELGDTPDWYQCTKREIQRVTDWHTSSVAFTVRPGQFREADLVYVFVVDASGNASEGVPIVLAPSVPPSVYATWRAAHFSGGDFDNDTVSGPLADPDRAGIANFARYAFDLPARGPVPAPITAGTADLATGRVLTLTFNRRAVARDLSYILEGSTDLATWTPVPGQNFAPGPGAVTARDAIALGTAARRFLRLRVTTP